mgnify:CR=1 FL=1
MLDPFEAAFKNAEQQSEKRMLDALAAKPAVFSYAKVKEEIEDRDATFEDLRQKYEALKQKKLTYEQVLKRRLDDLDNDFSLLQMQSQELSLRAVKNQTEIPLAA